jgi:hypothetical protein
MGIVADGIVADGIPHVHTVEGNSASPQSRNVSTGWNIQRQHA